jgi:hypothetical protein
MTAHARPRFAGLFHRRQPDLIPTDRPPVSLVEYWDDLTGRPPVSFAEIERDCADWDHPASTSRDGSPDDAGDALGQDLGDAGDGQGDGPPWDAAAPAAHLNPGPGSLSAFHAAADLRDQRAQALADEHESWYGWDLTAMNNPVTRTRPYAPEPEPEPEPVPVSYPPLDLHADLGSCVIFRDTVQGHFVRQEHARGRRALPGETWLQEQARVYGERFTAELDDFDRLVAGVPVPDYRIAEQWDVPAAAAGGMIP